MQIEQHEEPLTNDEALLLRYQKAHVEYHQIALTDPDSWDTGYEWEYTHAVWALQEELQDPILRALAQETNIPGPRFYESRNELLELSRRVRNLYPHLTWKIN
jgi:hypothetical protein